MLRAPTQTEEIGQKTKMGYKLFGNFQIPLAREVGQNISIKTRITGTDPATLDLEGSGGTLLNDVVCNNIAEVSLLQSAAVQPR